MAILGNLGTSLTLLLAHFCLFRAHREHKVHNIVLYPDKESWCKTTPIKQVVTWPSCAPQELDNNVCVGACFSYMVPHSEPSAPGDLIRPYCDSCQPLDSIWHTVTLDCKDKDDNPTTMQKKVQIITNCSCSSCMESSRIKPDFNSLLQSLESARAAAAAAAAAAHHHHHHLHQQHHHQQQQQHQQQQLQQQQQLPQQEEEQPHQQQMDQQQQLLTSTEQQQQQQSTEATPVTSAPEAAAASKSVAPADSLTDEAAPAGLTGAHETPDLLLNPNLNGSTRGTNGGTGLVANERFLQLFKQLNDPNLPQDKIEKLGKLEGLEKLEKLEKLATEYAGAKELLAKLTELLHKYSSQDDQSDIREDDEDSADPPAMLDQLLNLTPSSSSVAPPPALPAEPPKDEDDEEVPSLQDQQLRVAASLMHRTGPHHSLVLDSGVKEKIDVESHYLQPALEGQEISYHDNTVEKKKKEEFGVVE